ncbi:unnamed protein product [Paramecium sonneborni]|uniref:Uncharacterized protein n=1 Tax=Paramecium sonneborni TaxID=65129 RepID=A0A8S1R0I4_9CILI|nr:unnamed protein product [Paramecium sonneborni]
MMNRKVRRILTYYSYLSLTQKQRFIFLEQNQENNDQIQKKQTNFLCMKYNIQTRRIIMNVKLEIIRR